MKTVLIVYHFIAHYRVTVMNELLKSKKNKFIIVADDEPTDGTILSWIPKDRSRFILAKCSEIGPILYQKNLIKSVLKKDVDCVIFLGNCQWPMTWISSLLAKTLGKRVLFWTHGWIAPEQGFKKLFRNCFYKIADGLLLYGNSAKEIGKSYGFNDKQMYVIYNSLDYEQQKLIRENINEQEIAMTKKDLFGDSKFPVVICSTRLTKVRQLDLLFEAVYILNKKNINVNILLVGDGPELEPLKLLADKLSLNVNFYGACYDEKKLAVLTMVAHATVAPGKVGLTAMQSLSYGTPVITHNDSRNQMPEWEAIVENKSGLFFERNNVNSLTKSIRNIINQPITPNRRQACYDCISSHYTPQYQCEEIERAINGLPAS